MKRRQILKNTAAAMAALAANTVLSGAPIIPPSRKEHLIRMSLKYLEARLGPGAFWRVHRSLIVRVDQIAVAKRDIRGRYTLFLRERPESLRCSRAYGHLFKHM